MMVIFFQNVQLFLRFAKILHLAYKKTPGEASRPRPSGPRRAGRDDSAAQRSPLLVGEGPRPAGPANPLLAGGWPPRVRASRLMKRGADP